MILTAGQEKALNTAIERFRHYEKWTCISGPAGSGKSSLVPFIISALNLYPEQVHYIAFTGKAARVLQEKGCQNASTAHKFLYWAKPDKNGIYHYRRKPKRLFLGCRLIVVDEISMLPLKLWEDMLYLGIPILALGDPFQLPSITKGCDVLNKPHAYLDEIMRQAQDSEIIRLTMDLRAGKGLPLFHGNEVQILTANELNDGMLDWADQILCAKNVTRKKINAIQRKKIFDTEDNIPLNGDKIICLHNDYSRESDKLHDSLINGLSGTVTNINLEPNKEFGTKMTGDLLLDNDDHFNNLLIDYGVFQGKESYIDSLLKKGIKLDKEKIYPAQFDFGYCITCWKAQGSEWDKVLVLEENFPWDNVEHMRYLYTAATRAAKKLVVIKNYK